MAIRTLVVTVAAAPFLSAQPGVDFFEQRIRPLLAEKCYACHSATTLTSGGLRLDTRDSARRGGNRGPAVVPGQPDLSVLLRAVSHEDARLQMPPTGKLSGKQITDLTAWVNMGAPDPREESALAAKPASGEWWAFEPFRAHPPPPVSSRRRPGSWIDTFLLAKLESRGLNPAPPADKRTWIRRVTFDLTGLPPSPAEIDEFLASRAPGAHEKVVDRLLSSPHYGERWARHWLDLARYAETDGHEFDREKPNAWRYRDYVIRAFNADVPFDQFAREHIAGDLLDKPRLAPGGAHYDSPAATGFFGLGEERNAADDLAEVRAEKLDNQIDTLGKTFLGLSVACARCHDHKFDPIPTRDYYAIGGILDSKQIIQACLDTPERRGESLGLHQELAALDSKIAALVEPRRIGTRDSLLVAAGLFEWAKDPEAADLERAAAARGLDPAILKLWIGDLKQAAKEPDHLLYPFARLASAGGTLTALPFPDRVAALRRELSEWDEKSRVKNDDVVWTGFTDSWRLDGDRFLDAPAEAVGFLTSKSFRATKQYMHVRLSGNDDTTSRRQPGLLRVSLVGDGRDISFSPDASGRPSWKTANLGKMFGEIAYLEIADRSPKGRLTVDRIVLSDSKEPPAAGRAPDSRVLRLLAADSAILSIEDLAAAYQPLFEQNPVNADPALLEGLRKQRSAIAARLREPAFAMLSIEDEPRNLRVHIGGDHRNLGDEVPHGFLRVLSKTAAPFDRSSGRLRLADAVASPANPLTARVLVNRVWKHHFGEGLVRTVDNFGRAGGSPSHLELLDTLAARFVEDGWSIKRLHRTLVLSSAYRMSSTPDRRAAELDPENRLLHHMPVRRLEGEAIRDAILAVTGALDRTLYGPSVPPHISEHQDGRGKPAQSGPLDGAGRRSIYIGVRRNFLTPMLVAFDYPMTVTTIGQRGTSTVPSQALALMNNEFVTKQATAWADRAATVRQPRARIDSMYRTAFGRPAEAAEIERSLGFIARQSGLHGTGTGAAFRAWVDLAHVLFNSKEFIFVR